MEIARDWEGYAAAALAVAACTLAGMAMEGRFDIVNIAMVYVLAVVIIAVRYRRGAAIASAALSVIAFDVMFVPPEGTFTVNDVQYLFTFAIMLAVALVISHLMERGRRETQARARLGLEAESERIRSTLLASISHDLRTPLAVLTGASSTLVEGGERLTEPQREALSRSIYGQARDLFDQVEKILQMTRLEAGSVRPERDWASLAEIAGTVLSRMGDRLATHRVVVEVAPDLPLVRVDAPLVEQVLVNLLDNAARHTPPGTVVVLRAKQAGGELAVAVEDNGPGPGEHGEEGLFGKFRAGGEEGARGGFGLGLAICRAIVELHGGRIRAEASPGGGLAIRFTLPVEASPPPPVEAAGG